MKFSRSLPSIPRLIVAVTAVTLAVGVGAAVAWQRTGHNTVINTFFHYPGALFLISAAAVELWLSWFSWRQFSARETMSHAWFLIMLAAAMHLTGSVFSQVLGVDSYLNPLMYCDVPWVDAASESFRQIGLLIGGPLQMTMLACGLLFMLRVYRRSGLLARLTFSDGLLITLLALYTFREAWQVVEFIRAGKMFTAYQIIAWTSDPLLIVLLFEAICIRRAVLAMGRGLIAMCWGAFAAAIGLTALGDIGIWATWNGYLPGIAASLGWYVWFLAGAAYALGPAYQVEAFRRVEDGACETISHSAAA